MGKFMSVNSALARLVENSEASTRDRIQALRMMQRVPLCMLRRLLHRSRSKPGLVPQKLVAAATLAYAREKSFRKLRPKKESKPDGPSSNALGII